VETLSIRGDNIDNDCDGSTDEEPCNGIDDDSDGLVDEDCAAVATEAVGSSYNFVFMENSVDDNPDAISFLEASLLTLHNCTSWNYGHTTLKTLLPLHSSMYSAPKIYEGHSNKNYFFIHPHVICLPKLTPTVSVSL
jgi:hypothetical protein